MAPVTADNRSIIVRFHVIKVVEADEAEHVLADFNAYPRRRPRFFALNCGRHYPSNETHLPGMHLGQLCDFICTEACVRTRCNQY